MVRMPKELGKKVRTIHKTEWAPEETVTIKSYVGDYDRRRILSAASEYRQDEGGKTVILGTLERLSLTKRVVAIVSWTLQDEDGNPLPFTEEYIKNLPPEDAAFIDGEIDKELATGTVFPSRREAEEAEKQEKQDRATFPRHPHSLDDTEGPAVLGHNGRAGEGDGRRRRSAPAAPKADEGL